jgi:hypothetical protein
MKIALLAASLGLAVASSSAFAQDAAPAPAPAPQGGPPIELMFVQQADGMTFDGDRTLTLTGVAPATTFFSDRPQRIVGHINQDHFVKLWGAEKDGFKADPPNAALSLVNDNGQPIVIEIEDVEAASADSLTYTINVLEGTLPATGGAVALFIDPWVAHGGGWGGGWHDGGGWGYRGPGWGGVAAGAAIGAAAGVAIGAAAASPPVVYAPPPPVNCAYSPYYNQPVCKGVLY